MFGLISVLLRFLPPVFVPNMMRDSGYRTNWCRLPLLFVPCFRRGNRRWHRNFLQIPIAVRNIDYSHSGFKITGNPSVRLFLTRPPIVTWELNLDQPQKIVYMRPSFTIQIAPAGP